MEAVRTGKETVWVPRALRVVMSVLRHQPARGVPAPADLTLPASAPSTEEGEPPVSELVTICYPDVATAREALRSLDRLQVEGEVAIEDAVIVERGADGQVTLHPWIQQGLLETGASALVGGLIGTLFLAPLLGAALGAAAGATRAALVDLGIPDDFMGRLGSTLPPGSAAVMVLLSDGAPEQVLAQLQRDGGRVVQTSLSTEAERRLEAVRQSR